jgi:hypothetical protein
MISFAYGINLESRMLDIANSNIKLLNNNNNNNNKVNQNCISMAMLPMYVLLPAKNDTPQQTKDRFLHIYRNHSYVKAPNIYIILGTMNY